MNEQMQKFENNAVDRVVSDGQAGIEFIAGVETAPERVATAGIEQVLARRLQAMKVLDPSKRPLRRRPKYDPRIMVTPAEKLRRNRESQGRDD